MMQPVHSPLARELLDAYARRGQQIHAQIKEIAIPSGVSIINQDEISESIFILLKGSMKIHLNTLKGTEYLVAIQGAGEIIGEVEALSDKPATCSVTAMTESRVAQFSKNDYRCWLEEDHSFALLVNQVITNRLQAMTRRAAVHLSYPMEYSVLKLLKMMASEKSTLKLDISKEEIANYLGTSVRSINRIMNDLRNKEVLAASRKVEIISMDNLEKAMLVHEE